jgi:hypothetical protein
MSKYPLLIFLLLSACAAEEPSAFEQDFAAAILQVKSTDKSKNPPLCVPRLTTFAWDTL